MALELRLILVPVDTFHLVLVECSGCFSHHSAFSRAYNGLAR